MGVSYENGITRRLLTSIIFLIFTGFNAKAQDAQFSQFYNSPLHLNPALTGTFQGSYRVGTSYRDQWQLATGSPITTFTLGGDLKFDLGDKYGGNDVIGGGIMFYGDRVGILDFNTNQIALSGSYHKLLDKRSNQYIGIGIQGSIIQRAVSYENLTFEDQFNAIDAFSNPTGELLPVNNMGFGDLSLGINYSVTPLRGHSLNMGVAVFHLLRPQVSFYARDALLQRQLSIEDNLFRKWVVHGSYSYPYREAINLEPRFLVTNQGQSTQVALNLLTKVKSLEMENQGFFAGPGVRVATNQKNQIRPESIMLTVGYEYRGIIVGVSYDHSVLDISNGRNGFNSLEISFNYWGNYDNGGSLCPKF